LDELQGWTVVSLANNHGFKHSFVVVFEKDEDQLLTGDSTAARAVEIDDVMKSDKSTTTATTNDGGGTNAVNTEHSKSSGTLRRLILAIGDNSYGQIEIGNLPKLKQPSDIIGTREDSAEKKNMTGFAWDG
jgi:hypothetical protein